MRHRSFLASAALAAGLALGIASCNTSSGTTPQFVIESINLQDGQEWQINRPIQVRFSQAVDFGSVSLTTINVRQQGGANTSGSFTLADPRTVVFQPTCPTQVDLSDAALQPGGLAYDLTVIGNDQNLGFSVRSVKGQSLQVSERRSFTTPVSTVPADLFFDPVVGPPRPLIRGRDGVSLTEMDATYIEVGGDPDPTTRLYFEDTGAGVVLRDSTGALATMPLNLLSDLQTQVAVILLLNQPISPASGDPASGAVRWEYEAGAGNWQSLASKSELLANCTAVGAALKVSPVGVLPPGTRVRVVITTSLKDIIDVANTAELNDFAVASTAPPPTVLGDELFEDFLIGVNEDPDATLHDFQASLADPPAVWGGGKLSPGFDFAGTGGPGGDFDVRIPAGQSVNWSTISALLVGGPNFVPSNQVVALGGIFDVDDLLIEAGATLKIDGPNPAVILATGRVDIQGTINVSGTGSLGVVTLNTTNVPEQGTAGQCGGGQGGTGSPLTNASSPRGGTGFGAFNIPDLGGQGGETGWATQNIEAWRRGAGGGGGVLGPDQLVNGVVDESYLGLNAEQGFQGSPSGNGAEGGIGVPAQGGMPAPSPFRDGDPTNDFFGQMIDPVSGNVIRGELPKPWAASGGGGGGDASLVTGGNGFPDTPFKPGGDEKGAGGGGGSGSLTILAIGPVVWGAGGQIRARGGFGGGGESTNFVNRIGSASGGGGGGHVIVQSATAIDFGAKAAGVNGIPAILATGGQGGAGADDNGGATPGNPGAETSTDKDACPDTSVPGCVLGIVLGAGGDGGPGLIQLHSPTGSIGVGGDIIVPGGVTLGEICYPTPLNPLIPQFGRTSRARSVWVRLGLGGFDPLNPLITKDPVFSFNGTDPLTGSVTVNGQNIPSLPSILPDGPPPVLGAAPTTPYIAADEYTLVVDGGMVANAAELKANPSLLREYLIDLDQTGTPPGSNFARFSVATATYDSARDTFALTAPMSGPKLTSFGGPGLVDVRVRPVFFRIDTNGTLDQMPLTSDIQIMFQAAPADANGMPDTAAASAWTTDISTLNAVGTSYEFIRFEVLFDIDKNAAGLSPNQPRPDLLFLRMPFRY